MTTFETMERIRACCEEMQVVSQCNEKRLPDRAVLIRFIHDMRRILFPGYFGPAISVEEAAMMLEETLGRLQHELEAALAFYDNVSLSSSDVIEQFKQKLPKIHHLILLDIQAGYRGDPAAKSHDEVLLAFPYVMTIFIHRIAHCLHTSGVPLVPRILSEYAHSLSGIDIHPGALIGESFFIDHGTGVVIGETAVIGDRVKIYQGVTIGALSVPDGMRKDAYKRHPTIEDGVVIYANATILGGDTVIGQGSLIGGNVFVTESVDPFTSVTLEMPKQRKKPKKKLEK